MRKPYLLLAQCCVWVIVSLSWASQCDAQFTPAVSSPLAPAKVELQPFSSSAFSSSGAALPDPPDPSYGKHEEPFTPPGMVEHYGFLSRMSVGSGLSPFGIGVKGAVILTEYADARVDSAWLFYNTGRLEVSGVNVVGDFHFGSLATKLDWYPTKSVWRLSPGVLFYNGNRITANLNLTGGSDISINGKDYYSATANPATGATPLAATVKFGLSSHIPAFTISGGFGKFVPHSHRHWSFPSEMGIAFTGPPTLDVAASGWVCTDKRQTQCGNIDDPNNPVGVGFQKNLDAALVKWRHNLDKVHYYPIFSTAFMYSFDLPRGR